MEVATHNIVRQYCTTGAVFCIFFLFASILSVWFIDEKLTFFINSLNLPASKLLHFITEISPRYIILLEVLLLGSLAFKSTLRKTLGLFLLYAIVVALSDVIKTELKIILARNWPNVYTNDGIHGSLIGNNLYGFHFFEPGRWQGSYPSGHITFISSSSMIMSMLFKRYRYIFLALIPIMMIAILLQNYHFLGDCLSGIGLGTFVAYNGYAAYLWLINRPSNKSRLV